MGQDPFNIASTGESTPPPRTEPRQPKVPDPVKQRKCGKDSTREELCEESARCENDCDDMFSGRAEKTCLKLPTRLVYDFTELLEFTEDGDIDEIDSEVLECLLDIDIKEFVDAVEKMSRSEAEEFLAEIADNEDLAEVFQDEDQDSDILRALLKKISSRSASLETQLTKNIDDGKSFLQLAAEGTEEAWEWLNDYIEDRTNRDPIVTYCKIIIDMNSGDLRDLLDTNTFEDEYKDEVEDDRYSYEASGNKNIKDWCEAEKIVNGPCPEGGSSASPDSDEKLATITFSKTEYTGRWTLKYEKNNFCYSSGQLSSPHGDSDQNTILRLNPYGDSRGGLVLNENKIDNYEPRNKKYYLYINDERFELNTGTSISQTGCSSGSVENVISFSGGDLRRLMRSGSILRPTTDPTGNDLDRDIWLASEEDGECTYYQ